MYYSNIFLLLAWKIWSTHDLQQSREESPGYRMRRTRVWITWTVRETRWRSRLSLVLWRTPIEYPLSQPVRLEVCTFDLGSSPVALARTSHCMHSFDWSVPLGTGMESLGEETRKYRDRPWQMARLSVPGMNDRITLFGRMMNLMLFTMLGVQRCDKWDRGTKSKVERRRDPFPGIWSSPCPPTFNLGILF